jgi:glycosyltransferase involved in cell wall biosynthesis
LPNQFWSSKNHKQVIDALVELRGWGVPATIVCTGKTHDARRPRYFEELMDHCARSGVADQIRVLGVVPYVDTQGLMAHARAVINPSRFEGWSTTVEEARTLQKRILLSDIPVHREQSPPLGRFFPLDDARALATLIGECLAEEAADPVRAAVEADYSARLREFGATYLRILKAALSSVE